MFCREYKQKINKQTKILDEQAAFINAIEKSSAIIEFDLSGKVLTANPNFLHLMGYELEEIVGKPHRIFIAPEEASSAEYEDFWRKLRAGDFVSSRFKRIAKNGNTIWLEASYNPILDKTGKPYKFVKFATDITEKVQHEIEVQAEINAINSVMATIEFDTQGNILTANDNFLKIMGYTLSEIQGKHHSMFAVGNFAQTPAYKALWDNLAKGQAFSDTYERKTKNGETVWLEGSYNPILNPDGQVCKVIKYATDIGSNKNAILLDKVIDDASNVIDKMAGGNLSAQMQNHIDPDAASLYDQNIIKLSGTIEELGSKLQDVISEALEAANTVNDVSGEVATSALDLSQRVQEQAAALEETSATMNEMNSQVQSNTQNAQEAEQVSNDVQSKAKSGQTIMVDTINAMENIQESSHRISDIVTLIDGIAFQTNLLALNAAVEAARAGEHGRGFAVVAGEVRNLAQKSAEAAKDIKNLIEETVTRVTQGVKLASDSGEMLTDINDAIQIVTQMITQIAQASTEQAEGVHQVHQAITQIDEVTQQNAALVEETSASAENLKDQSESLNHTMGFFNRGTQHQSQTPHKKRIKNQQKIVDIQPVENNKVSSFSTDSNTVEIPANAEKWEEF
nr:methyl-accepting chemotaxis protein [Thiomicrorhabdus sp. Milos-T2]